MKTKAILSQTGLFGRTLVLLGLLLICVLLAGLGFSFLYTFITGDTVAALVNNTNFLKGSQLVQSLAIFVVPAFVMALFISKHPLRYLDLTKTPGFRNIILTLTSMVVMVPAMNLIISWNESMKLPSFLAPLEEWFRSQEDLMGETTRLLLSTDSAAGWIFNLFLVGVVAAFSEEIFFRGLLQNMVRERWHRPHLAIWVVAILFSAIHLQFYGFFPRLLLGAYFGYLLFWTGSIWIPIIAHFTNNAIALLQFYLESKSINPNQWFEDASTFEVYAWGAVSGLLFYFLMILIKRRY